MKRYLSRLWLVTLACVSATAVAEELPLTVSGDLGAIHARFAGDGIHAAGGSFELNLVQNSDITTLRLHEVPFVSGKRSFETEVGVVEDRSKLMLLEGTVADSTQRPAAGAVYDVNGRRELHLFTTDAEGNFRSIVTELTEIGTISVSQNGVENRTLTARGCGSHRAGHSTASHFAGYMSALAGTPSATSVRILDVNTIADHYYHSRWGASSNNRIASIIHAASMIYASSLNMEIRLQSQQVLTSPVSALSSTNSDTLLTQFQNYQNDRGGVGSSDVVYLMTARDLDDDVIGIANMGVICADASWAYGIVEDRYSEEPVDIFAHELAHNLNADHDESQPPTLMYPMATGTTTFSSFSRNEISQFVSRYGSCLATGEANDPSEPPSNSDPGDGDTSQPVMEFQVSFSGNNLTGFITRADSHEGTCLYAVELSDTSSFRSSRYAAAESSASTLTFNVSTAKRSKDKKSRVYLRGYVVDCSGGGEDAVSSTRNINVKASRGTKRSNKVSTKSWIKSVTSRLALTE